jgi:ribosome maturation protein Sdo1
LKKDKTITMENLLKIFKFYFNVLKSRLNKKNGITYDYLVKNVKSIIKEILSQTYHKLFIGSYQRSNTYKPKKIS